MTECHLCGHEDRDACDCFEIIEEQECTDTLVEAVRGWTDTVQ